MIKIDIIAAGKQRDHSSTTIWNEYIKRINWSVTLHEIDSKTPQKLEEYFQKKIQSNAYLIVLDERGKNLSSVEISKQIEKVQLDGNNHFQFIIGGPDGVPKIIKQQADFLLSFGAQTWPHKFIRIMLAEQLYRAQQILIGHPYHR